MTRLPTLDKGWGVLPGVLPHQSEMTFQFDANVLGTNPTSITKVASFFIDHSETTTQNGDDVLFNLPGSETQFLYNGYTYGLSLYSHEAAALHGLLVESAVQRCRHQWFRHCGGSLQHG